MQRLFVSFRPKIQFQTNSRWLSVNPNRQYRIHQHEIAHQHRLASTSSDSSSSSKSSVDFTPDSASSATSSFYNPHPPGRSPSPSQKSSQRPTNLPPDWDEDLDYNVQKYSDLPSSNFGDNQHIRIDQEFDAALRQILSQFRAVQYAFAYGSGVFPQSSSKGPTSRGVHPHPNPAVSAAQKSGEKVIDFIFGVTYTQHWHSLNLKKHRDHYSAVGSLGSSLVSRIQDDWGAGVYFNPYVNVNGNLIKYGVVQIDTLCSDLKNWDTLYLAGRLQKPVKIIRNNPMVSLASQVNLMAVVRTALLLLPPKFTEEDLYKTITGISYLGDPRMTLGAENLNKVENIVKYQMTNFRRLYGPLIETLPNVNLQDPRCSDPSWVDDPSVNVTLVQDMDPIKRGNMVRRLPKNFREKLYFRYQSKYQIPQLEFNKMLEQCNDEDPTRVRRRQGGPFERRLAGEEQVSLNKEISMAITQIIKFPSYSQSLKGIVTAGLRRSWRYLLEKWKKHSEGQRSDKEKRNLKNNQL